MQEFQWRTPATQTDALTTIPTSMVRCVVKWNLARHSVNMAPRLMSMGYVSVCTDSFHDMKHACTLFVRLSKRVTSGLMTLACEPVHSGRRLLAICTKSECG